MVEACGGSRLGACACHADCARLGKPTANLRDMGSVMAARDLDISILATMFVKRGLVSQAKLCLAHATYNVLSRSVVCAG